jgi:hypothetical protein
MYFLATGATRYMAEQGEPVSTSTLRYAVFTGQLEAIKTVEGARVFEKSALDAFITFRREKKTAPKPLCKAA